MAESPDPVGHIDYMGEELELFQSAENWKRYCSSRLRPYVTGQVLEVGAGLGANVPYLYREDLTRYLSLEPDSRLCCKYRQRQEQGLLPGRCELAQGTLESLPLGEQFDSIIYIDVVEHIQDDRGELTRAYHRLRPNGYLLVLCPAHNFLFSPFDKAIGHFRRYNNRMYQGLLDRKPLRMEYLDSVGMAASMANRWLLKQSYPGRRQILLWDRWFVRISRILDPLLLRSVGKSILGVWKK